MSLAVRPRRMLWAHPKNAHHKGVLPILRQPKIAHRKEANVEGCSKALIRNGNPKRA